eukprot:Nitzschia sp. Nitz4//scaffold11_size288233//92099//93646//NITZ4_000758-RA/size288233-processed-gene-0.153-mRNA-1//1//CDS//3329534026//4040//frame0
MKHSRDRSSVLLFLSLFLCGSLGQEASTCSWAEDGLDPALKEMTYDVGDGPQTFMAYVEPDVTSFYQGNPPSNTKVVPKFNGLAGKFINMSNKNLVLYYETREGGSASAMRNFGPFSTGGTATFPGHRFFFTPEGTDASKENRVIEFVVKEYPENLYVYDPYLVEGDEAATKANLEKELSASEREIYDMWKKTLLFNDQYKNFTGRSYLANYLRDPPTHFLWPADYFGQEHWFTTRETHFESLPPLDEMDPVLESSEDRALKDTDDRNLQEYRVKDQTVMNMTVKVLSCAPRVYEIPNFLSESEVQHILELADGIELSLSTTGDVVGGTSSKKNAKQVTKEDESRPKSRTSFNSWLPRESSLVVDAIYRRASDLLRIDEALLRRRSATEYPDLPTRRTVSEPFQLVHYSETQEYTAHHDFGYADIQDKYNGARFATLLLYLNGNMTGGETSFPRWSNAETFHRLSVAPEAGKAVLFYSQLPDGNLDDFSQHAAEPIRDGEKWLINLWVWDPIYEL